MSKRWSKDETDVLIKYYGVSSVSTWANLLPGRSIGAIIHKAMAIGLRSGLSSNQHTSPVFDSRHKIDFPDEASLEEMWSSIQRFTDSSVGLSNRFDTVKARIDTSKPIAVGFLADDHIGAVTCKYDDLKARVELMASTPGFYLFSGGDTIDNYLPDWHNQGMFGQVVPPAMQKQLVEHLFIKLKGKWLGIVQGCHDEASHKTDDFDWTSYLASRLDCPNMGFGGLCELTVGKTQYDIMLRHKYRFNSSFNLTHTVKRMREQIGDFDIGCVAHHHQAAIEQVMCGDGVDRVFIRPGSFKGADRYARSLGYKDTGAYIPTVILYPERRFMMPFLHLEQAIAVLNSF